MWQEVTKKNISTYFFIGLYYKDFPTEINMYLDSGLNAISTESRYMNIIQLRTSLYREAKYMK